MHARMEVEALVHCASVSRGGAPSAGSSVRSAPSRTVTSVPRAMPARVSGSTGDSSGGVFDASASRSRPRREPPHHARRDALQHLLTLPARRRRLQGWPGTGGNQSGPGKEIGNCATSRDASSGMGPAKREACRASPPPTPLAVRPRRCSRARCTRTSRRSLPTRARRTRSRFRATSKKSSVPS
jgi:hypothetical protein